MYLIGSDTHHARSENERWVGDFSIIKATEGKTFVDPKYKEIAEQWNTGRLRLPSSFGLYHFLSEKSNITEQIQHFISTVEPFKGHAMLILDYEQEFSRTDPAGTCLRDAIKAFQYYTNGMQCVIYMNKSDTAKIAFKQPQLMKEGVCLWLADYKGDYNGTWAPIMRQVCSNPFDIDVFYGSWQSWEDIAKSWK